MLEGKQRIAEWRLPRLPASYTKCAVHQHGSRNRDATATTPAPRWNAFQVTLTGDVERSDGRERFETGLRDFPEQNETTVESSDAEYAKVMAPNLPLGMRHGEADGVDALGSFDVITMARFFLRPAHSSSRR